MTGVVTWITEAIFTVICKRGGMGSELGGVGVGWGWGWGVVGGGMGFVVGFGDRVESSKSKGVGGRIRVG